MQRCRYQQLESRACGLRKSTGIGFGSPVLGLVRDQLADRKAPKVAQDTGEFLSVQVGELPFLPQSKWKMILGGDPYITSMAIEGRLLSKQSLEGA